MKPEERTGLLDGAANQKAPQTPAFLKRMDMQLVATILTYCAVNSSLLVVNKLAVTYYPYPGTVLLAQLGTSALIAWGGGQLGWWVCDPLLKEKVIPSLPVVLAFFGVIYSNMNALQHVNVDTMVVFRTCIPFGVALFEYLLLDRELPSARTWGCLTVVAATTAFFFSKEITLDFTSLAWLMAWFAIASFDQLYLKRYCSKVELTAFGRTFYNNLLGCVPAGIMAILGRELPEMGFQAALTPTACLWVILSCFLGFGLSLFSWILRAQLSALSFTMLGVLNKIASVALNASMWEKHGSLRGQLVVVAGIAAGAAYREPAMRDAPMPWATRVRNFAIQGALITAVATASVMLCRYL